MSHSASSQPPSGRLPRTAAWLGDHERLTALAIIGVATVVRLLYAVLVNDPASGPDAPTYDGAARVFAANGPFVDAPGIPYWPAGYALLLTPVYAAAGDSARVAMALQVALLGVGSWFAWTLTRRELGRLVAMITLIALSASPALAASSSELMYEVPLLIGTVIGADLLSRSSAALSRRAGRRFAAAGGLVLGLSATMQPKLLVAAAGLIVLSALRARSAALIVCGCLTLAIGPIALAARTHAADGHFALSANLGTTMLLGLEDQRPECSLPVGADQFQADRARTRCAVEYLVRHPGDAAAAARTNAAAFWAPFANHTSYTGTWFHALSPQRLLPARVRESSAYHSFDDISRALWELAVVALVLAGFVLGLRDPGKRWGTTFVALPTVAFFAVSLVTRGDARFRLPVAPSYVALQAIAVTVAVGWAVGDRRHGRGDSGAGLSTEASG